jgi:hypothetical protein
LVQHPFKLKLGDKGLGIALGLLGSHFVLILPM